MLQTLIVAIIVVFAAVWMLMLAYTRIRPSQNGQSTCGCGCSGCNQGKDTKNSCEDLIRKM